MFKHINFFLVFCTILILSMTASHAQAEDALAKGKSIYDGAGACAGCHGPKGAGDGPAGGALNPKPTNLVSGEYKFDTDEDGKKGTEEDILNVISNGAAKYGGSPLMVARADISEADRKALAKYVASLKSAK